MIDPALVRTEKLKAARERQDHARELGGDLFIGRSEPANYSNAQGWASFVTSAVAKYRP
jgi:hypothetical protein